jgi:hypothetical protein
MPCNRINSCHTSTTQQWCAWGPLEPAGQSSCGVLCVVWFFLFVQRYQRRLEWAGVAQMSSEVLLQV